MATGQVLFHRFYCKKSFARFNVKRVAASCVWLASKLEESPRKAKHVLIVFHRMECRRENLPVEHLDPSSKKYVELKMDLNRSERHILKEMGFICHVEHPHKFISNYLATLGTPTELRQEAWNLANDRYTAQISILRTTLCVRFKSEVVACGVVYAAARRFQIPLPENPPWWKAFDAEKSGIDEVCRVLSHLYSLPKAKYIHVCKETDSSRSTTKAWDSQGQAPKVSCHLHTLTAAELSGDDAKINDVLMLSHHDWKRTTKKNMILMPFSIQTFTESLVNDAANDSTTPKAASNADGGVTKDLLIKAALDKLKVSKKNEEDLKTVSTEGEIKEETAAKSRSENRTDISGERIKEREREKDRIKVRDRDRGGRDSDREREREKEHDREREKLDRDREKLKERSHRVKEKGKDSGTTSKSICG
ncbi:Cyclin-L1-1 [Asimina triloba]